MGAVYNRRAQRGLLLFFLSVSAGFGQPVLGLESGPAEPGSTLLLNLKLTSGQTAVAGLQWTLNYTPSDVAAIQVATSPAAAAAGQMLTCANRTAAIACLLVDPQQLGATVPDGPVAVVTVTISPASTNSSSTIGVADVVGTTPNGEPVSVEASNGVLTIEGPAASRTALRFVPVTPCRVADTRNANGPLGGPAIQSQTSRDFAVPNGTCGIPSTALAYSLNVAVVPQNELGYVTVWPTGQPQPLVATLNSLDGRVKSNAAIVPAGSNGGISVYATDTTQVILDINGYFVPASGSAALGFYPVTPCRIVDTRNGSGSVGGPSLASEKTRSFPIGGRCGIPASAQAYSLNFAVVPDGSPLGYLTAWPVGQTQPVVATLNAVTGTVTANAVIVPAGTNGAVDVFATNQTELVIDTDGYFSSQGSGGLSFYSLVPCRALDTREGDGAQPFHGVLNVNVGKTCGLPAGAKAYVFNATVVPQVALGYLTMWPAGEPQPLVSTLNALDMSVTSNMAIVPTTNGSISVFASNPTHLVLDIFGYFAP
jgi:hypothetical protein